MNTLFRYFLASALLALPFVSQAQTHPCFTLLQQSAHAGVAAKICHKQVNMEALTTLHQQNQCAAFFAQESVQKQIANIAKQASQTSAQEAAQLGEAAYCQKSATDLGSVLK